MKRSQGSDEHSLWAFFGVWGALLALLAATVGSSFVALRGWNTAINVLIALVKALLVAVFFMHLRSSSALVRLIAIVGVAWLMILVGLSLTDFLMRGV